MVSTVHTNSSPARQHKPNQLTNTCVVIIMAKQTEKNVARTTIKAELVALAVEYTVTEQVKQYRDRIKELDGGKYQAVFAVAQRSTNKAAFDTAVEAVKAEIKAGKGKIDRTYSNAVSAVRRYWALCIEHEGKTVKVDKAGNTVKIGKSIKTIKTFNMLKSIAEGAKKQAEQELLQGRLTSENVPADYASKLALLNSKLPHMSDEMQRKAIDAALAFCLVGGEAKHGKAAGENTKQRKASAGKASATAKDSRTARPPAQEVTA